MPSSEERIRLLNDALRERILVLDGAMGTQLQDCDLDSADFGGPELEGCNENLVLTRPDVVRRIHAAYYAAGADIVETNTFGATAIVLAEYGLQDKVGAINRAAAELARAAADEAARDGRPRFVAGSMGPTTKAITVTGGVAFHELAANFRDQAQALTAGGCDLLLLETCQDTRNVKAALIGIDQAFEQLGVRIPVMVSGTIEPMGTMLAGQSADALVASLQHVDLLAVGLNCATGPEFMTDHVRTIHELARAPVSCYPNAGLPNEDGLYLETPESLAGSLERFVRNGWLNMIGGCCGTTPAHIRALAEMVSGREPRRHRGEPRAWYSGIELVQATDETRPLLVGERTNVVGSRKFKRLIAEEKYEEAAEIARVQVKKGAHIVDINLENPDRDELTDIDVFYSQVIQKVKVPLMIDSTSAAAVERALTYCQGKTIVNSINFEDGEERFDRTMPLVKRYGAAVVVGSIDEDKEQAQAITRERKLAVAERAYGLITGKWQVEAESIIFDPLVFPCATGDENYIGSAVETIEGLRLIKAKMPRAKTVLGVSNVSFGLPPAAREVVNSVFLYQAAKAGLDMAIVNTQKLERYAAIPEEERKLAEDLLGNYPLAGSRAPRDYRKQTAEQRVAINQHHIAKITARFRGAAGRIEKDTANLPLDERLANYIVEGTKTGLVADLETKLAEGSLPLDIINGPLMAGMSEVGRLFNDNELIVAEVLQSAEAMKAAVDYLKQFMEKGTVAGKGKIVLATVKGDVHDIGKNLVEIILANNGYTVVNLGIKVPPEELIEACRAYRPDAVGLSGLLVKSARQMVVTAQDLQAAGIDVPLLVGGAALSKNFTRKQIAPAYRSLTCYAQDAMSGLALLDRIMDDERRTAVALENAPAPAEDSARGTAPVSTRRSSRVRPEAPPLPPPYTERIVREVPQLREVWSYINPVMLFNRHLGFKGNFEKALAERDPQALELHAVIEELKAEAAGFMKVCAVWRFFEAESEGNTIRIFEPGAGGLLHAFTFPRQRRADGLSLADFVARPNSRRDALAMFCVGAGQGIREHAEAYKQRGEYLKSHGIQALALETAEGCAEWLHRRIREDWGFPDCPEMSMLDRFKSNYRGRRYSFGYAACPDLEDQEGLFKLLKPEDIGVHLTSGLMMTPEASVSALVLQHPDCIYFDVNS